MNYVRVNVSNRKIWAEKNSSGSGKYLIYQEIKKDGSQFSPSRITIALPGDVIWEKPARMNFHYGHLEV